jgi:hypothetical protein
LAGSIVPKIRKSAAVSIYPHAQTLIRTVHSPLMRFTSGDVGGTRTSLMALKRDAAAEKSEDQHSRDFSGCSIFDFSAQLVALLHIGRPPLGIRNIVLA